MQYGIGQLALWLGSHGETEKPFTVMTRKYYFLILKTVMGCEEGACTRVSDIGVQKHSVLRPTQVTSLVTYFILKLTGLLHFSFDSVESKHSN